ncbi:MAG: hypothetical protein RLZZ505_1465 [Verrucomicrobiota bacterium]
MIVFLRRPISTSLRFTDGAVIGSKVFVNEAFRERGRGSRRGGRTVRGRCGGVRGVGRGVLDCAGSPGEGLKKILDPSHFKDRENRWSLFGCDALRSSRGRHRLHPAGWIGARWGSDCCRRCGGDGDGFYWSPPLSGIHPRHFAAIVHHFAVIVSFCVAASAPSSTIQCRVKPFQSAFDPRSAKVSLALSVVWISKSWLSKASVLNST